MSTSFRRALRSSSGDSESPAVRSDFFQHRERGQRR